MKISKKTKYYGIAIVVALVAIGVYVWYTSSCKEGFVNNSAYVQVSQKFMTLASDPEFAALRALNPAAPNIAPALVNWRYGYPWILIAMNEPAGPIKLSRIKAYFDGQVDINPLFTIENAAFFLNDPANRTAVPFAFPGDPFTIGQFFLADPVGKVANAFFPNPPTPPFQAIRNMVCILVAIASQNVASMMLKGTVARTDYAPANAIGYSIIAPMYTQAEKDALVKIAPKILSVDDDTDPKIAFTLALTDAKTKNCATGSYQGQTPSFSYVGGGACTDVDKLMALRNKLKPEEYQAIIVQVFSLGPPPPPPPAPIAPTIPVPPVAAAAPPPPVDDKSGGPVPVASSSGAYAASCTRCTLLNNQLSCSCDVTAR